MGGTKGQALKGKFVNIKTLSPEFVLDIKYATADNFLKQAVYDCGECYLREATAKALLAAQKDFLKRGYTLKLFDCYRPLSVQKKMWKILPGTHYVANPAKGSKHNRGAAVDLTLVDLATGKELDMGTPFDTFSPRAQGSLGQPKATERGLEQIQFQIHLFRVVALRIPTRNDCPCGGYPLGL